MCVVGAIVSALVGVAPSRAAAPPAPTPSPSREWTVTPDLAVRELRPGVWLHRSWGRDATGERTAANGLVVRDADGLVIVDTPWGDAATEALLGWIARELGEPVRRVIVTHAHDDRMGGAHVVRQHAIPLLASPRTVEVAAAQSLDDLPMALAGLDDGKAVNVGTLEVFNPGPAHSPDNVVVWLPAQRILFAGCAVKSADATSLGFTGDANLARWPDALRRVKQRYPRADLVVPGHGDPGGATLVDKTRALLARRAGIARPATPRPRPTASPATPVPTAEATPEAPPLPPIIEIPDEPPVPRIILPAEGPH